MGAFGAATTAGKYGLGFSMLAAALGSARGADSDSIDGFASGLLSTDTTKWILSWFVDDKDLEEGGKYHGLLQALDGQEGAINTIIGSALVLPKGLKAWGIGAGIAWLGYSLYKANKEGKLTAIVNQAAGAMDTDQANRLNRNTAVMSAEELAANVTINPQALREAESLADQHSATVGDQASLGTSGTVSKMLADASAGKHAKDVAAYDAATRGVDELKDRHLNTPDVFKKGTKINQIEFAEGNVPFNLSDKKATAMIAAQHVPGEIDAGEFIASASRFAKKIDPNNQDPSPELDEVT